MTGDTGDVDGDRVLEQVVDPDDYNQTRRLREIHDARQRVAEFLSRMELPDRGGTYHVKHATRLGHLVALYVMELEPLIVQSDVDEGDLVDDRLEYDSLLSFAANMGVGSDGEPLEPRAIMQYFSAANRFYAEVGMDLELESDQDKEAEIRYSDILGGDPP